ncbi:MAG: nitronate monooxygenase family protein [Lawsonibacter sp.]|nr:nitronate monooxygenase family protein [Lawsonibacter sp.]
MVPIGTKNLKLPVLQGGMGVGVSLGGLAGAVAACGGMGCISAAQPGYREADFRENSQEANIRALKEEIVKAKALAKGLGLVAVNIMVAMRQYASLVRAAVEAGADAIISGAGLPLELPGLTAGTDTALAPIVSSGRAAKLILKTWDKRYGVTPEFVVIEGREAGGHLGFPEGELLDGNAQTLEEILPQVLEELSPYEQKYHRRIPVFVAGGGLGGEDLIRFRALGAAGVQIATRLIATEECDAAQGFKDVIVKAGAEDVRIIHSPVGMPGRAIATPLVRRMESGERIAPLWCTGCIKRCDPAKTPYCITNALIEAVKGNVEEGLFFCGAGVGRVNQITTVAQALEEFRLALERA